MKIIAVSNFDNDVVSDKLIAENVPAYYSQFIVDSLNNKYSGENSDGFYKAVEDDYKLYEWKP